MDNHIEVRGSPCCRPSVYLAAWASAVGVGQWLGAAQMSGAPSVVWLLASTLLF